MKDGGLAATVETPRALSLADLLETLAREEPCAHRERVRPLLDELLRRTPVNPRRVKSPIEAARHYADLGTFQVPPSHRKRLGVLVSGAKQLFVHGLRPLHRAMLAPQQAFNAALLESLETVLAGSQRGASASAAVREGLTPLAAPAAWRNQTGGRFTGRYLDAVGPLLTKVLARQGEFNLLAIELLALSTEENLPSVEIANARIRELAERCDPLGGERGWPVALSRPLWREVLRRQAEFNREVMLVLSNLLQGRPPVVAPPPEDYPSWYQRREPAEIEAASRALLSLRERPLFSLVVPAWETPPEILETFLASVRAQRYERWELCVVDDGSRSRRVLRQLKKAAARDPRIRVERLERNQGIAAATNAALRMARGEWIAFMDHDDALPPHALAEVALELARRPELDWLYTDEDRLSADGKRREQPFFKPDFSPDLLRTVNYICHFVVARRSLVTKIGGLREGFQGSQDYDFLLRLSEESGRVGHIPKILYHWRSSPISLSRDAKKLEAASRAGVRALEEHLQRKGEAGTVGEVAPTHYRVRYPVRGEPKVSIIIPFKDRPELLERLLPGLLEKTRYTNFELLLVSNNSTQPRTFELLERIVDPRVRKLTWDHPFNYPALNNWAARESSGELLLFLNNDMEIVDPDWLHELISQAQRPEVGAVGPKLLFPDGSIQHAGVVLGIGGFAAHPFWRFPDTGHMTAFGHADWTRNYLAVTSACVMLRRAVFEEVGGYDERFLLCGSDVHLGLKVVESGRRVVYTAATRLVHHESASRRNDDIPESDFWHSFRQYRGWLERGDPFYNPNLTLTETDCSLREDARSAVELAAEGLARHQG